MRSYYKVWATPRTIRGDAGFYFWDKPQDARGIEGGRFLALQVNNQKANAIFWARQYGGLGQLVEVDESLNVISAPFSSYAIVANVYNIVPYSQHRPN